MKTVTNEQGMKTIKQAMAPKLASIDNPLCRSMCQSTSDTSIPFQAERNPRKLIRNERKSKEHTCMSQG